MTSATTPRAFPTRAPKQEDLLSAVRRLVSGAGAERAPKATALAGSARPQIPDTATPSPLTLRGPLVLTAEQRVTPEASEAELDGLSLDVELSAPDLPPAPDLPTPELSSVSDAFDTPEMRLLITELLHQELGREAVTGGPTVELFRTLVRREIAAALPDALARLKAERR